LGHVTSTPLLKFHERQPQVEALPAQLQALLMHLSPWASWQFWQEEPQCWSDAVMSTHAPPPQAAVPGGHAQLPLWQVFPFWQTFPQKPQLELSFAKSRHLLLLVQQCPLAHCPSTWQAVELVVGIFEAQLPPMQARPLVTQFVVTGPQAWLESQADAMLEL
jgi:hypothetical protein